MYLYNLNIRNIKEYCDRGAKIICFGSGRAFYNFWNVTADDELLDKVKFVVDNDELKQGYAMKFRNKYICDIIPFNKLLEIDMNNYIIIVTTGYLNDVLKQLSSAGDKLKKVPVTYYGFVLDNIMMDYINNTNQDMLEIPQGKEVIPRRIHYCWFGGRKIPDQYKKWMNSWRKYCPDYEIIRWDESNYDICKIPYMREAYGCAKYSFVSDYARFDILYQYGGIYLDTDVEILRPLDDLLCQKAFMGTEFPSNMIATGLGMGAVPRHDGIKLLMNDYVERKFIREDGSMDLTTCPIIQSSSLAKYGFQLNGERQTVNNIEIYPNMVFSPYLPYRKEMIYNDVSYLCHHYAASWVDENKIYRNKSVSELFKLFSRGESM